MNTIDLERVKAALNNVALWFASVNDRTVPLSLGVQRGELLSSIVLNEAEKLTGGDLAAFFAGATSDRVLMSMTAEDIRDLDEALVELRWFLPNFLSNELSASLHPAELNFLHDERIAS